MNVVGRIVLCQILGEGDHGGSPVRRNEQRGFRSLGMGRWGQREYRIRRWRTCGIEHGILNNEVELVRNIAPYMLISTVVMAAGFQYQAEKTRS